MTSGPLQLISSMATKAVLAELAAQYLQLSSQPVTCSAAGGVDVARRVQAGEVVDVVVLAANVIDQLTAEGHLIPGSRVDLVQSGIAIAVRTGAPRPDVSTQLAVRQAVLAAASISYSTGPSGVYLVGLFERWGILEQVKPRIVQAPPGVPVGSLVASGAVELGFQQLSELIHLPGIALLGPMPAEIQLMTTFSGGIATLCQRLDAARSLLAFMQSPSAVPAKLRNGMQPA